MREREGYRKKRRGGNKLSRIDWVFKYISNKVSMKSVSN
jgi:hypothetical protein